VCEILQKHVSAEQDASSQDDMLAEIEAGVPLPHNAIAASSGRSGARNVRAFACHACHTVARRYTAPCLDELQQSSSNIRSIDAEAMPQR
jgi:hypothetical protein